jgi:hypothetical protein
VERLRARFDHARRLGECALDSKPWLAAQIAPLLARLKEIQALLNDATEPNCTRPNDRELHSYLLQLSLGAGP